MDGPPGTDATEANSRCARRREVPSLYAMLHSPGSPQTRFNAWVETLDKLPRGQTRVLTWPLATVFRFIAPDVHIVLKPNVTRAAARVYGFEFPY